MTFLTWITLGFIGFTIYQLAAPEHYENHSNLEMLWVMIISLLLGPFILLLSLFYVLTKFIL